MPDNNRKKIQYQPYVPPESAYLKALRAKEDAQRKAGPQQDPPPYVPFAPMKEYGRTGEGIPGRIATGAYNVGPDLYNLATGVPNLPFVAAQRPIETLGQAAYGAVQPWVRLATGHLFEDLEKAPVSTAVSYIPALGLVSKALRAGHLAAGAGKVGAIGAAAAEVGEGTGVNAAIRLARGKPMARPTPPNPFAVINPSGSFTDAAASALVKAGIPQSRWPVLLKDQGFLGHFQGLSNQSGPNSAAARQAILQAAGVHPAKITRSMLTRQKPQSVIPNGVSLTKDAQQAALADVTKMTTRRVKTDVAAAPPPTPAPSVTIMGDQYVKAADGWINKKTGSPIPPAFVPAAEEDAARQVGASSKAATPGVGPSVQRERAWKTPSKNAVAHDAFNILNEDPEQYAPHPADVGGSTRGQSDSSPKTGGIWGDNGAIDSMLTAGQFAGAVPGLGPLGAAASGVNRLRSAIVNRAPRGPSPRNAMEAGEDILSQEGNGAADAAEPPGTGRSIYPYLYGAPALSSVLQPHNQGADQGSDAAPNNSGVPSNMNAGQDIPLHYSAKPASAKPVSLQDSGGVLPQLLGIPSAKAAEAPQPQQAPTVGSSYFPAPSPSAGGDGDTLMAEVTYDPAEWKDGQYIGPRADGGRVAYKKGGKVSPSIEPLVQDLMSRYKHAKKAETATTKPLLQHHDKAIVKALNIAKKAI